jgi:formylglycine-generating enzyme required for sulfatase activity
LCEANERVVNNACVPCPAGTTNAAGDNASGSNTTCDAVICGEDERVESNACVPCPAGTTNEAGDDASGADTTCTDICSAGTVLIPGGTYTNGATPQAERTVGDVCMDQDEVTVAEYTACVADGGCTSPNTGGSCNYGVSGRENHPVNCVDWFQADAFCTWSGQRLPTEWEWEWAARGRDEGRTYPWGAATPSCTYAVMYEGNAGCGLNRTWEVGSKSAAGDSRDGLRDMAGNVWEWTGSWSDSNEVYRVLRGGSWANSDATLFRAGYRRYSGPSDRGGADGFRCARTR